MQQLFYSPIFFFCYLIPYRVVERLDNLTASLIAWKQFESGINEFNKALGKDKGDLKGFSGALDLGDGAATNLVHDVKEVAKRLSEKMNNHVVQQVSFKKTIYSRSTFKCSRFGGRERAFTGQGGPRHKWCSPCRFYWLNLLTKLYCAEYHEATKRNVFFRLRRHLLSICIDFRFIRAMERIKMAWTWHENWFYDFDSNTLLLPYMEFQYWISLH